MSDTVSSNKQIAKNTLMLYFRMLLTMAIGLYTSRVILSELGVSDYGLYSVVGGIVTMFSFINGSLNAGTQRFMTFYLGKGDTGQLKKVFSTAIVIYVLLALAILILAETVGLWFLLCKMNIEPERLNAAKWVYQFSIISCMVSVIQVPFMSALVAHEKFEMYAYMSIYDAAMKLVTVFFLVFSPFDKLIFYALLVLLVNSSSAIIYNVYCHRHFEECCFSMNFDKGIFKKMFSFSAWDVVGSMAVIGQMQGINIIINLFCGTIVNAAYGIATTVNNVINTFATNIIIAANPQIVKSYAQRHLDKMYSLVVHTGQMASYLMLTISIPVFIEIEFLLRLWLGEYPAFAPLFIRIILLQSWVKILGEPTIKAMHAVGNIKYLNIIVGPLLLVILPVTYFLLRHGYPPETALGINVIFWAIAIPIRLTLLRRYCGFPIFLYLRNVVLLGLGIAAICFVVPYIVQRMFSCEGWIRFLAVGTTSVLTSVTVIFLFGLPKHIRSAMVCKVKKTFQQLGK